MPSDIGALLRDAAASPRRELDVQAAVGRAKRLTRLRIARILATTLVLLLVVTGAVVASLNRSVEIPPVGLPDPPSSLRDELPRELDDWVRPGLVLVYRIGDTYNLYSEGVMAHPCVAGAADINPEGCLSTAQHVFWNPGGGVTVAGGHDLGLTDPPQGAEILWRGFPSEGSIGVRSPGACSRIQRFDGYECKDGDPVYLRGEPERAGSREEVERAAREFGFGRFPTGDVRLCPSGPFATDGTTRADIREAVAAIAAAANSPRPQPDILWQLMDPALQGAYSSFEEFTTAIEGAPLPRVYTHWEVGDNVWGPALQRLVDVDALCGRDVAEATWMGNAYFPRFKGVSGGAIQLLFLAREDGLRLWFTY
jgi:hypothetical protein